LELSELCDFNNNMQTRPIDNFCQLNLSRVFTDTRIKKETQTKHQQEAKLSLG